MTIASSTATTTEHRATSVTATIFTNSVALLLIVAAMLKTYQSFRTTPEMAMYARAFELGLIEFELIVGGMLLLKLYPRLAWGLTVVAFTIFTGVSVKNTLAHVPACGCFGPAAVNPRVMAAIDALIVVGLLMTGPRPTSVPVYQRLWRTGVVAVVAFMFLAVGISAYAAVPKRGLVADEHGMYDFGTLRAEDAKLCEHTFVMRNTSSRPIRVTGSTTSCACTVAEVPSAPIPAGSSAEVRVQAHWAFGAGSTYSLVTLKTDSRWTPEVHLTLAAQIIPAE